MAIVSSFTYADEAEFLDQLILPTLERLGFSLIARYHGTRELGKDVVFAELDRFAHVRYHALQVKYVPSIGLSDARSLIDDCEDNGVRSSFLTELLIKSYKARYNISFI